MIADSIQLMYGKIYTIINNEEMKVQDILCTEKNERGARKIRHNIAN